MTGSFRDRLNRLRQQQFIGRLGEREMVRDWLQTAAHPIMVLYIYGPGGIGKTTLLGQISTMAEQAELTVVGLDGRHVEPSPAAFLAAVAEKLGIQNPMEVMNKFATAGPQFLLSLDTAELLKPLEAWLRETFLPNLPATVRVAIAGRTPPAPEWRSDPGWREVMHLLPLKNLSEEESRALLVQREVPAREHRAILHFTHGHPLALALVSDVMAQKPETQFRPEEMPDVVKTLLEQFLKEAPSPTHRAALEAASQIRLLNEPLLKEMLQVEDAHPYFTWLRDLSFMEAEPRGLYPHDLAREAVAADLRWRNPEMLAVLHDRARGFFIQHFKLGTPREQRHILEDYVYLHRENPVIQPFFEWQSSGVVFTDQFKPEDGPAVLDMIAAHEGKTAAEIAAYWLDRRPEGVIVMRATSDDALGVLFRIPVEKTTPADRKIDSGCRAIWQYLQGQPALRGGETATLFRFWMAKDSYQDVSPTQSRIFLNMVQHYLTQPELAYTFIPCADPEFWLAMFSFADLHRLPAADFEVDGRSYGIFVHDWRRTPPLNWLALMARRELGEVTPSTAHLPQPVETPLTVLDEEAFAAAVRGSLRDYASRTALESNPLINCRLVHDRAAGIDSKNERAGELQILLKEVIDPLQDTPRGLKLYRALHHTYLQPAPTQEKAAELLDLPFSTYRRHLRQGVAHVVERLWGLEVGSSE